MDVCNNSNWNYKFIFYTTIGATKYNECPQKSVFWNCHNHAFKYKVLNANSFYYTSLFPIFIFNGKNYGVHILGKPDLIFNSPLMSLSLWNLL